MSITRAESQHWIFHGQVGQEQFPGHWSLWWNSFCFSTQKALQFVSLENWHPSTTQSVPKLSTVDCGHNTTGQGFMWWCCLTPTSCMDMLCFEWHFPDKSCYKASSCPVAGRWGPLLAPARCCSCPEPGCLVGLSEHVTVAHICSDTVSSQSDNLVWLYRNAGKELIWLVKGTSATATNQLASAHGKIT